MKKRFSRNDFEDFRVERSARIYADFPESAFSEVLSGFVAEGSLSDDEIRDIGFRHYSESDLEIGEPPTIDTSAVGVSRIILAFPFVILAFLIGGAPLMRFLDFRIFNRIK